MVRAEPEHHPRTVRAGVGTGAQHMDESRPLILVRAPGEDLLELVDDEYRAAAGPLRDAGQPSGQQLPFHLIQRLPGGHRQPFGESLQRLGSRRRQQHRRPGTRPVRIVPAVQAGQQPSTQDRGLAHPGGPHEHHWMVTGIAPGDLAQQALDDILPAEEPFVVLRLERLHPRIGTRRVVRWPQ